jgi:hypothetical protein
MKLGFITHSKASADMVTSLAKSLDSLGLVSGQGLYCKIEINTLYELAYKYLETGLRDLEPLSIDGLEGRQLQEMMIKDVLKEMSADSRCLKNYSSKIDSALESQWFSSDPTMESQFTSDLMNEFASVLDSEGIREGEREGEKYAKKTRRARALMSLPSEIDRRFILEIHRRYCDALDHQKMISVDQIVIDFDTFLDSNTWNRIRDRDGYDALFVDEMHLFTVLEYELLRKLVVKANDEDGRPRRPTIFMAYDNKQSTRSFRRSADSAPSQPVRLNQVFRYTPQISNFLRDLDGVSSALDGVNDTRELYDGESGVESGELPRLIEYIDEASLFRGVMGAARRIAKRLDGDGRRIAVLCVSQEMFSRHLETAYEHREFKNAFFLIDSREVSSKLQYARTRFVFSMPEYVAGLQFDTVLLMHIDAVEAPSDPSARRQRNELTTNIYLGASRAEKVLILSSCQNRGGTANVLHQAITRNTIEIVSDL